MDEDELEELRKTNLQTSMAYDTFGATAAEAARHAALEEAHQRHSAVLGLLPEEAVVPVAEGMGIKLLQAMGWRQGKGVGTSAKEESATVENTPLYRLTPKIDVLGLGYDPYLGAEEFRAAHALRNSAKRRATLNSAQDPRRRSRGVAFGTGVLDEDDAFGILEDYVTHDDHEHVESYEEAAGVDEHGLPRSKAPRVERSGLGDRLALRGYAFEVQEEEEEEESDGGRRKRRPLMLGGPAAPALLTNAEHAARQGLIPGFVGASEQSIQRLAYYPPPTMPSNYVPVRCRQAPARQGRLLYTTRPVPPPEDPQTRQEIDRLAFFIARHGASGYYDSLLNSKGDGKAAHGGADGQPTVYSLLRDQEISAYLSYKVASLRAVIGNRGAPQAGDVTIGRRSTPLTAEERGGLLDEEPLQPVKSKVPPQNQQPTVESLGTSLLKVAKEDRQRLREVMGSMFVKAQAADEPQKESATVGLRPPVSASDTGPEPQADAPKGNEPVSRGIVTIHDLSRRVDVLPPAAGLDPSLPVRSSEAWRPEPLLCKRLDVPDPYRGRPKEPPASVPLTKFRMQQLALPATAAVEEVTTAAQAAAPGGETFLVPPSIRVAADEAAAATALNEKKEVGGDGSSAEAADAFLAGLFTEQQRVALPETEGSRQGGDTAEGEVQPFQEKPVDLFKAIFEEQGSESDEYSSESEPEKKETKMPRPTGREVVGQEAAAVPPTEMLPGHQFGFAKFYKPREPPTSASGRPSETADSQRHVAEALRVLKEVKRAKKEKRKSR